MNDYTIIYFTIFITILGVIGAIAGCKAQAGGKFQYEQICEYQEESQLLMCVNAFDRCYITGQGGISCVNKL